jgi:1-acyl-sn-glycerol-3-phosphate acyltransferase
MVTKTPILFLYIDGNLRLWPKGALFAKPGKLTVHIGPIQEPTNIETVYQNYMNWVKTIDPSVVPDDMTDENDVALVSENLQQLTNDEDNET